MGVEWQFEKGSTLISYLENGNLSAIVPSEAGVYAWRLDTGSRKYSDVQSAKILENLVTLLTLPQGRIEAKHLSHSMYFLGMSIEGRPMSDAKKQNLSVWLSTPNNARWFQEYLQSIAQFLPNLYVGNTENLSERIGQHLEGKSGFGEHIIGDWPRGFEDLTLHWVEMPGANKPLLESIEYLTTTLTVSAFTKRAG